MAKVSRFCLVLMSVCIVVSVVAGCPHEDDALIEWTNSKAWDDGKVPSANADVIITKPVLLNTSPPELHTITIEENGKLVWSPNVDIYLRVHYILIYGEMHIGSEDCKYNGKTTITLIGERGAYDIPGFNEKFIGVPANGTLELHGEDRLSWTKLTKTLPKLDKSNGLIFTHKENTASNMKTPGMQIYIFDPVTGKMEDNVVFQLIVKNQRKLEPILDKMIEYLEGIPIGKVVAMAVQKNIVKLDLSRMFDAIEELGYGMITDNSPLRLIETFGAWAMVTLTGVPDLTQEDLTPAIDKKTPHRAEAELVLLSQKRRFRAISEPTIMGIKVDVRVSNTDFSLPKLDLIDDVSKWRTGDTLLISSTDYNFEQAEFAEVIDCQDCSPNQVQINLEPKYTHFGEIYKNVDMRAEVALLTRNIKIQGDTTDEKQFGGHIKMLKDFKSVHIEGIELTKMGQQTDLGRYPIHFHMCEDVDTKDDPPYIRSNSIHHTFARCTTIHGTHGLRLINNVCFGTLGIGYFLEDGGEKRTVFDGNLGGGQYVGGLIPVDKQPATFWITNPQTYLRNNVAVGGMGPGYWFTYPDLPIGPSADKGYMQEFEARHTAIYEFYNNVAHSNIKAGLFIDNILSPKNIASDYNRYQPWNDPLDSNSGPKEVLLDKFTGYKNRKQNVWVRGGLFRLRHFSLSDSVTGLSFVRENKQEQYFSESVILGDSINLGEPNSGLDRSLPVPGKPGQNRSGISFRTGPVFISTTWFDGFKSNDVYEAGAITSINVNNGHGTAVHSVTGLQFGFDDGANTGNRVCDINDVLSKVNDDHIATFRDIDGSVTSVPESQVVPIYPFYMTGLCEERSNWRMAHCPYYYGLLIAKTDRNVYMVRDDDPKAVDVSIAVDKTGKFRKDKTAKFQVILGGSHSYIMYHKDKMPSKVKVLGKGLTRDDSVRIGVCVPMDATIIMTGMNAPIQGKMKNWVAASSVEEIDADTTGVKYFHDSAVGVVFFKLLDETNRGIDDHNSCTDDTCPSVLIDITKGDLSDCDCSGRAYPKYSRQPDAATTRRRLRRSNPLPATSSDPPAGWGAGPTR